MTSTAPPDSRSASDVGSSAAEPQTREPRGVRVLVALEVVLAALLILPQLGSRSLGNDESFSVTLVRLPWSKFAHLISDREGNMVLHSLILRAWVSMGTSEVVVRSLSVLCALATIPLLFVLARRLLGTRTALLGGLLLVVNGIFVHFARETRAYAMCMLLVTASTYLFVRGIDRPSRAIWLSYAVCTALVGYSLYLALLVPMAHAATLVFLPKERRPWRRMIEAAGLLFVLLLPLAKLMATGLGGGSAGVSWASGNAGGRAVDKLRTLVPRPVGAVLAIVAIAVVVVAIRELRRRGRFVPSMETWRTMFVPLWLLVPLVLIGVASYFAKPLFVLRYMSFCVPPLAVAIAWLLTRIRRRAVFVVCTVVVVAISAATIPWYYRSHAEDFRSAAHFVSSSGHRGDGVLFVAPFGRMPIEYYLPKSGNPLEPVFPKYPWGTHFEEIVGDVHMNAKQVETGASGFNRVWLVLFHEKPYGKPDPRFAAAERGLSKQFTRTSVRHFDGVTVVRYDRSGNGPS